MDALRGLASLAAQAGDLNAALEFHVRLIDLGERSPEVLYNAALMYEKDGQNEKAMRLYRDALAKSGNARGAPQPGAYSRRARQSDEARTCWTRALDAEPALAQGYFGPAIE